MGIKDKIKSFFAKDTTLQSDLKRFNSDLNRSNERFKALESASTALQSASNPSINEEKYNKTYENQGFQSSTKVSYPIELQKESLQLGMAAGYTGKSIREIESSLSRIESQMTSKEWFASNFEDNSPQIIQLLEYIKNKLEQHDVSMSTHFDTIEKALNRLSATANLAPEPIRREMVEQIENIKSSLPLTAKMKELVNIVKENGDIGYDNLSEKLGVSRSSLRGLLSNTMRRTGEIYRKSVNGKGHVLYKKED